MNCCKSDPIHWIEILCLFTKNYCKSSRLVWKMLALTIMSSTSIRSFTCLASFPGFQQISPGQYDEVLAHGQQRSWLPEPIQDVAKSQMAQHACRHGQKRSVDERAPVTSPENNFQILGTNAGIRTPGVYIFRTSPSNPFWKPATPLHLPPQIWAHRL